jgi:DNA-directed RNA polymerase specialized sigma24 family protein
VAGADERAQVPEPGGAEHEAEVFEAQRRCLGAVAYRLPGTVADAQDVLQDAWLRWREVDHAAIENPRAYLTTVVTRLCYDQLGSARARREAYFGEWLPEPLVDDAAGPQDRAELGEEISLAVMALLESHGWSRGSCGGSWSPGSAAGSSASTARPASRSTIRTERRSRSWPSASTTPG